MKGEGRRGTGMVLTLVLVLIMVASVVALARSSWGSRVAWSTGRAMAGDEALDLAGSALEEAHFRLSDAVNQPGSEAFRLFREGTGPFSLSLGQDLLPGLGGLLGRTRGFVLDGGAVAAAVLFQAPASGLLLLPFDRYGSVQLTARVVHKPSRVARTLRRTFDFRMTLTTAPRFLDTYTLFLRDIGDLLRLASRDGDANQTIATELQRLTDLQAQVTEVVTRLTEVKSQLQGKEGAEQVLPAVEQLLTLLQGLLDAWPRVTLERGGGDTSSDPEALHLFPGAPLLLYTYAPSVDLASLNLPDTVTARLATLDTKDGEQRAAQKAFGQALTALGQGSGDMAAAQAAAVRYVEATRSLTAEIRGLLLQDYKSFQDALVEVGGAASAQLEPFLGQLAAADLLRKASLVIGEVDAAGAARDVSLCLRDLAAREGGVSGLVFIDNPTKPLVIDGAFQGRLVVVASGEVNVQRATVMDVAQDLLTVIAFGALELHGEAQASLVAAGPFRSSQEAAVTGNLVLGRLDLQRARPAEVFAGQVRLDERVQAGPKGGGAPWPDYEYVTLGPAPILVDVERR